MVPINVYAKQLKLFLLLLVSAYSFFACDSEQKTPKILVFSKTAGFYHQSIPAGIAAIQKLGKENGFLVDTTKNAAYFTQDSLQNYDAVVFLSTTGDVLDLRQQAAFERYIQAGGSFVGIHSATDTEYDWPWYNKLVGAYFMDHPNDPNVRKAVIEVVDSSHQSMKGLPHRWERVDEWYNYRDINSDMRVLAQLDETTYEGGKNGANHPIAWYHEFDGGRSFYTGGGHTDESFSEPLFLQHLLGGIQYAIGNNTSLDYSKAHTALPPEENRFVKTILSDDLNEPMELAIAPDGRVFFIERAGKFYVYDPASQSTKLLHDFPVKAVDKYLNGLLGMTIDPDFDKNNFLYFFHTVEENKQHKQHISRFKVNKDGYLDLDSEKVIIEVPIDLEVSAHTGGSMAWDKDKNLYISTGDNTVPFESDGYAPIDEREGRHTFDAQRSSANPNDLRGKILRIHPEKDGSYTIPDGNLFPKGTPGTRPEIYVMGCRNPYRIAVDQETGYLYWGEIGPDAGENGKQGPRGYDELNQARKAGNYGWPYFIGNNKPYKTYDFATKKVGDYFDADAVENNSVFNTGATSLPPAQPAMIWYPYSPSKEFPQLGEGGRCIMGGPVYHFDKSSPSKVKIPEYYDKALFIYDWMRNWIFAVRLDENHHYQSMEPFMPTTGDFRRPVDMEIGPDGAFYMLEYGSVYGIDNEDARLVKVEFNGGNRTPIAAITVEGDSVGMSPLTVNFSAANSKDLDNDKLTYNWQFAEKKNASDKENASFTFDENGIHYAILTVTDPLGASDTDTVSIIVGNTKPEVKITSTSNSTFFFDNDSFDYAVVVTDKEDARIDTARLKVTADFIADLKSNEVKGHQSINYSLGKVLMEDSDCKACHQIDKAAIGPTFMAVAEKYADDKTAIAYLANKIITGGGGVWGEPAMNAHPQLSREDATEIVQYILALRDKKAEKKLPQKGKLDFKEHTAEKSEGVYLINATYTDLGEGSVPLSNSDLIALRPARIQAEEADQLHEMTLYPPVIVGNNDNAYFVFKDIDLKGIKSLTYQYSSVDSDGTVEVRVDALDGPIISTFTYAPTGKWENSKAVKTPIKDPGKKSDLYFVIKKTVQPSDYLIAIDWIEFGKK